MWYGHIVAYDGIYMACKDGIYSFFDKDGKFLTKTYKAPSPDNCVLLDYLCTTPEIIEENDEKQIIVEYTYNLEFTTEGLLYGIGKNIHNVNKCTGFALLSDITDWQYIFVPYENE